MSIRYTVLRLTYGRRGRGLDEGEFSPESLRMALRVRITSTNLKDRAGYNY